MLEKTLEKVFISNTYVHRSCSEQNGAIDTAKQTDDVDYAYPKLNAEIELTGLKQPLGLLGTVNKTNAREFIGAEEMQFLYLLTYCPNFLACMQWFSFRGSKWIFCRINRINFRRLLPISCHFSSSLIILSTS